jgi:hypothetical protein
MPRQSWLDAATQSPLIDEYTQEMTSFLEAMADGRIDAKEIAAQEEKLVQVMKEVEPKLDDALHAQVTKLLCELTAYNLMQTLSSLQDSRPRSTFRG